MTTGTRAKHDDDERVKELIAAGGALVAVLAAKLRAGTIDKAQFIAQATALLRKHGETAGTLGAGRYGAADDFNADSLDRVDDHVGDFADTAADTGHSDAQVAAWAVGLAGVVWSIYQRGKRDGGTAAGIEQWNWKLNPEASHCDDCIAFADDSPYTDATKPGDPGDGCSACGGRCRCEWEPA